MEKKELVKEGIKLLIIIAMMVIGWSAQYITMKSDSFIEQLAEKIIEKQTGYKIDFTPDVEE